MKSAPAPIADQLAKIDALHQRVERALRAREAARGDRVYYPFIGEIFFPQQATNAQDIVFQVPSNDGFVAERLSIYPAFRFVTPDPVTNGPDEISYRPCILSNTQYAFGEDLRNEKAVVDCLISLVETYQGVKGAPITRALQNIPTPAAHLFSSPTNFKPAIDGGYFASFEFPSAMVFPDEYYLPPGSSITCKIAPVFAALRSDPEGGGDPTLQNEYRLTVVLEGYKVVS